MLLFASKRRRNLLNARPRRGRHRARIQYHITERPTLLAQAEAPLAVLLAAALQSHRIALSLDETNADVLFNTAQVLSSLAEVMSSAGDEVSALTQLEEAVALFAKCLTLQNAAFADAKKFEFAPQFDDDDDESGGVPLGAAPEAAKADASGEEAEQWASIVEPVTEATLIETCIAALDVLSSICGLDLTSSKQLEIVNGQGESLIGRLQLTGESVDVNIQDDIRCAQLRFQAALSDARFRAGTTDWRAYNTQLAAVLEKSSDVRYPTTLSYCMSAADACMAFAATMAQSPSPATAVPRWSRLDKALSFLKSAASLPSDQASAAELAPIHMSRGDAELSRYSLCAEGTLPESLSNPGVRATLLKNAGTYYRGAVATAGVSGQDAIVFAVGVKAAVVECLSTGSNEAIASRLSGRPDEDGNVQRVLKSLVDESLVSEHVLRACGLF